MGECLVLSTFPFNPPQAGRELFAVLFVVGNTLAALSVAGAAFFCAGTINIVMWAGHGGYYVIGYSFRRKAF